MNTGKCDVCFNCLIINSGSSYFSVCFNVTNCLPVAIVLIIIVYYIYVTPGPSLLIESTDSMIIIVVVAID